MVWVEGMTMGMAAMDLVRNLSTRQLTAAYDRGAVTHAEYVAALDYQRQVKEIRQAADRLDDRMTERDGLDE